MKVSKEEAAKIGQNIISAANLNLNDDVKSAMELAPPDKRGEVMAAAYQISMASMISERRASRIAVPALSTEKEFRRRFMLCFKVYAEMMNPRGLRCTHQMAINYIILALFHEIHGGGDWRDMIDPTATYSPDAANEYAERMFES